MTGKEELESVLNALDEIEEYWYGRNEKEWDWDKSQKISERMELIKEKKKIPDKYDDFFYNEGRWCGIDDVIEMLLVMKQKIKDAITHYEVMEAK